MEPELVTGGGMVNPVNLQTQEKHLSNDLIYIKINHIYMLITIELDYAVVVQARLNSRKCFN